MTAGRHRRDCLFFIVYAGLLSFAFVWARFPHVRPNIGDLALFQVTLAAGLAYVGIRCYSVLTREPSGRWDALWVTIDLVLITALVYLSGGIRSEVALMYIMPIATYSIQRRFAGTTAVGLLAAALYVLATWPGDPGPDYIGMMITRLLVLLLVTFVASCYANHETVRVNELTRLRAELALAEYRRELSSEIHDGIQHYLVSIAMRLEIAGKVAASDLARAAAMAIGQRAVLRQASDELRYLVRRLRAPSLEHHGFVEATREHLDLFRERSGTKVVLDVEGTPSLLPPDVEHAAFRIIQESLTNAEKHAKASTITVTLTFTERYLASTIRDDGVGFDPSEVREEPGLEGGFGLPTMRQRAEQAGGQLELESAPGQGTCIRFLVPITSPGTPLVRSAGGPAAGASSRGQSVRAGTGRAR